MVDADTLIGGGDTNCCEAATAEDTMTFSIETATDTITFALFLECPADTTTIDITYWTTIDETTCPEATATNVTQFTAGVEKMAVVMALALMLL